MRGGWRRAFRRPGEALEDVRADVDEELELHLELAAAELRARGWMPAEAQREAERRFGDLETTREVCARESERTRAGEERRMRLDSVRQDLRYAVRTLWAAPGYTAVVVVTLAVGIALNTLVFSVMSPYLVRPLPYAQADRLVHLGGIDRLNGWDLGRFSAPQLVDLRERSRGFEGLAGYYYGTRNLVGDDAAERLTTSWVTGNLFPLLGVDAALGRVPGPADDVPGAPDVVALAHGLWTRRFGADPGVIGRAIRLDGRPHTVVGVLPASFNFPFNAVEMWLPMRADPARVERSAMNVLVVGRLADGWTAERAGADLNAVQAELAATHPETDGTYDGLALHPLREALNFAWDVLRPAFLVLLGAVGLVLVIACVNVASLTLARAGTRGREVAVRAALGAGRRRIVRQLLVEGAVLALVGGALGAALAHVATGFVRGIVPPDIYRVGDIGLDGRALLYTALVTLLAPLVFGLAPALASARTDLASVLRQGGTAAAATGTGGRRLLVLVEVALAVVLVTGTALMTRSLGNALSTDLGFDAARVLTAGLTPSVDEYADASLEASYERLLATVREVPGVEAASAVSHLPMNHESIPVRLATPDGPEVPVEQRPVAYTSRAGSGYFETMGIPIVAGRGFGPGEVDHQEGSVVITRRLAEALWPDGSAVGRLLRYGSGDATSTGTVVGVVGDVRWDDLAGSPRPHLYRPLEGSGARRRFLVVRSGGTTSPLERVDEVRTALAGAAPGIPAELRAMTDIVRESTGVWAIGSAFLAAFGAVALALAALGIYGLVSFSVARRRAEIGLRIALGADPAAIGRAVLRDGLSVTLAGLALGLVLSVAAAAGAAGLLFGVGPLDLPALGSAAVVFALVSVLASLVPVRRAVRVDPVDALRTG